MADYGQGAQGALGGAATGASIGALGGPIGAGIGAGAGALLGFGLGAFGNNNSERDRLLAQQEAAIQAQLGQQFGTPQLGGPAFGGMGGPFRTGQLQLIGQLQQQAAGQGPSLATGMFNQALDRGANQQVAASQAGTGNAALNARAAAGNIGNLTQDLAGQAAQARIQEQMIARQQLGGVLGQGRGMEMQGSQFNAGAQNQFGLAQADLEMRNRQFEAQRIQNLLALQQGLIPGQQPGLGTQLLSGGGSMLAQGIGQGMFNFGGGGTPGGGGTQPGFRQAQPFSIGPGGPNMGG